MKMTLPKRSLAVSLLLSTPNFQLSTFAQGSLTPPGAPAPTMKSLDQIEPRTIITNLPFTITSRGSYYLTNSIIVSGGIGITVAAEDVTIDLNGFALSGGGSASGSGTGVVVNTSIKNLVIRNGTIRRWSHAADVTNASNSRFEGLQVYYNEGQGMLVGDNCAVKDCVFEANINFGLTVGQGGIVSHCSAKGNGGDGFRSGLGSALDHCSATFNSGNGFTSDAGTMIVGCASAKNTGRGFNLGIGNNIKDCTSYYNHGVGIAVDRASIVSSCSVFFGDDDGIFASQECQVLNNTSSANGTGTANFGIHITGNRNRVEGNNVTDNFNKGIDCGSSGGNLIIKNSATVNGGGNYINTVGNDVGPIGTAATSTSPWANIAF